MIDANYYYIRIVRPDNAWQQVVGVKVVLENYPDIDLFVSRGIDEDGEFFRISEGRTGGLMAIGDTEEEAQELMEHRIREYCRAGRSLECLLERKIKKTGISPRYEAIE